MSDAFTSQWVVVRVATAGTAWGNEPTYYATSGTDGVPVRGLPTEEAARALVYELEVDARRTTPLTAFLGLRYTAVVDRYFAAMVDAGLATPDLSSIPVPPEPVVERRASGIVSTVHGPEHHQYNERLKAVFREWWPTVAPTITPEVNAKLWDELFPEHRFYGMHRVPIED